VAGGFGASRTGGADCHQSASAGSCTLVGASGSVGSTGSTSKTCFEVESDCSGGAACSAGKIGTMSPTDPERWPLSGGALGRGAADVWDGGSSTGTAKTFRQAALGQRTNCPRRVACT
jgi:hypothetical protein